ncbi:MAG TPA: serine/threonine-protein kinase [Kofleriaceae bacterium]|nr:serine/threonine-protein kinase [Kofleriaceae bacterium]
MNVESHIGQYKILRTLGAGGMGTVYLGEHILLGRRAAIKTLMPALSSHHEIVDRFFNEAKAISAISDPGVVQIFDFGYHVDGTAYIVMEMLEGESLSTRLERLHQLTIGDALRIARQITASLASAHALGIVHRDLKPGNVFIIRDAEAQSGERTKILDFGICKLGDGASEDGSVTQTGQMLGTPVYMSPEQCRGAGKVDHRTDIYSVGCALYHMLTGQPPFNCESVGEFIAAHLKEDAATPSEIDPTIPPSVDALVMRCLAKDPANRFQSMKELHGAIERALAEISDHGARLTAAAMNQTPLATGFHSQYDVNEGRQVAAEVTPSAASWFVDSMSVPASSISDEWEAAPPPPRRRLGRTFMFAAALFIGIVGGLNATSYALDDKRPASEPPMPLALTTEEPRVAAGGIVAHETAPPELEDLVASLPDEEEAPAPKQAPAPKEVTVQRPAKVTRPPRPYVQRPPQPRRHVPASTTQQDDEDLYDAR